MENYKSYLLNYDGPPLRIMEVCGTHTSAIAHSGIASLISPKIQLISGPGCPVCVTVSGYIDRLIELSLLPDHVVVTFGDMIRVPGQKESLAQAKSRGACVRMVYSPFDILPMAKNEPSKQFVFAAVGFETTAAVYASLMECLITQDIKNVKLLTSIKTMPTVLDWVCSQDKSVINGFLAPGHVSVITGYQIYEPLARKYKVPFAVAGFEGENILQSLYALVKTITAGRSTVMNLYPEVVSFAGNLEAQELMDKYFTVCDGAWRGIGTLSGSGLALRPEYRTYDVGSKDLVIDQLHHPNCRCGQVITGQITSQACPIFGNLCTPETPYGACMVSQEGACYIQYSHASLIM